MQTNKNANEQKCKRTSKQKTNVNKKKKEIQSTNKQKCKQKNNNKTNKQM